MKYDEIKRKCVDCGKEFIISSSQQSFYRVREWELPKRCKECREKKKQEWKKKEAEKAAQEFEKELTNSPYTIKDEYSCAVTPQVRQTGNRLSGPAGTAYASLLT